MTWNFPRSAPRSASSAPRRAAFVSDAATAEAERQAGDALPFVALAMLVSRRQTLSDDEWANLHETVSATFGSPLARAASRGLIAVRGGGAR